MVWGFTPEQWREMMDNVCRDARIRHERRMLEDAAYRVQQERFAEEYEAIFNPPQEGLGDPIV